MQERAKHSGAYDAAAAVERVRSWPRLSAAAREAWEWLFELCGRRPATNAFAFKDMAADLGVATCTAARRFDGLERIGFIKTIARRRDYVEFTLVDPLGLERPQLSARLRVVGRADGQASLLPPDEMRANVRAVLRAEEPEDESCAQKCAQERAQQTGVATAAPTDEERASYEDDVAWHSFVADLRRQKGIRAQGSRHAGARENLNLELNTSRNLTPLPEPTPLGSEPAPLGAELPAALGAIGDPQRTIAAEASLVADLEASFAGLARSVARRLAKAIVDGSVEAGEILDARDDALRREREGLLDTSARQYFIGTAKRILRRRDVPWHEARHPP